MRTLKVAGLCLAGFIFAGITFVLVLQRDALNRVRQENGLLQQQVDGLA